MQDCIDSMHDVTSSRRKENKRINKLKEKRERPFASVTMVPAHYSVVRLEPGSRLHLEADQTRVYKSTDSGNTRKHMDSHA